MPHDDFLRQQPLTVLAALVDSEFTKHLTYRRSTNETIGQAELRLKAVVIFHAFEPMTRFEGLVFVLEHITPGEGDLNPLLDKAIADFKEQVKAVIREKI